MKELTAACDKPDEVSQETVPSQPRASRLRDKTVQPLVLDRSVRVFPEHFLIATIWAVSVVCGVTAIWNA